MGKNAWRRFGVLKWINKLAWKFGKQLHKSKEHLSHFEIFNKKGMECGLSIKYVGMFTALRGSGYR